MLECLPLYPRLATLAVLIALGVRLRSSSCRNGLAGTLIWQVPNLLDLLGRCLILSFSIVFVIYGDRLMLCDPLGRQEGGASGRRFLRLSLRFRSMVVVVGGIC